MYQFSFCSMLRHGKKAYSFCGYNPAEEKVLYADDKGKLSYKVALYRRGCQKDNLEWPELPKE